MNVTDKLLEYINNSPTPVTSPTVAAALVMEDDAAARGLAGMNQRKNPLIARQPVSPERKTSNRMYFEYMSLAMAKELGVEVEGKKQQPKKVEVSMPKLYDGPPAGGGEIKFNDDATAPELPLIEDIPQPVSSIERMARLMGRRIARIMMEALQAEIEEQLDRMGNDLIEKWAEEAVRPAIHRTQPATERAHKPKVLIAGLLPAQAGLISSEFGEVFDLRFYMTDDNLKKLRNMLRGGVDHFMTFTSKIEHQAEHMATSLGYKIIRCSGGMTMLREKLEELFINEAGA
jgi:hypothetical protein